MWHDANGMFFASLEHLGRRRADVLNPVFGHALAHRIGEASVERIHQAGRFCAGNQAFADWPRLEVVTAVVFLIEVQHEPAGAPFVGHRVVRLGIEVRGVDVLPHELRGTINHTRSSSLSLPTSRPNQTALLGTIVPITVATPVFTPSGAVESRYVP